MAASTSPMPFLPRNVAIRLKSGAVITRFIFCSRSTPHRGLSFKLSVAEPYLINNFESMMMWRARSSTTEGGQFGSSDDRTGGGTRLVRAIRALQARIDIRFQELRKNLPLKLLFFLVGFYSATAFATMIGQTGDWDILSAALAVAVVEAIGALMYKGSLRLFSNVKSLVIIFNYWKAGLSLGLFLDSFKVLEDDANCQEARMHSLNSSL
ncbi:Ycf20-like protein [Linum perenne]